jgi:FMN reductase
MIVVISGNPRPGSRTLRVATEHAAELVGDDSGPVTVIDVAEIGVRLLRPDGLIEELAAIAAADTVVVATPTYKATFTGVLKVLLDALPHRGLAGKTAVPVVTAGTIEQADRAAAALSELLAELGADVQSALRVTEAQLVPQTPAS